MALPVTAPCLPLSRLFLERELQSSLCPQDASHWKAGLLLETKYAGTYYRAIKEIQGALFPGIHQHPQYQDYFIWDQSSSCVYYPASAQQLASYLDGYPGAVLSRVMAHGATRNLFDPLYVSGQVSAVALDRSGRDFVVSTWSEEQGSGEAWIVQCDTVADQPEEETLTNRFQLSSRVMTSGIDISSKSECIAMIIGTKAKFMGKYRSNHSAQWVQLSHRSLSSDLVSIKISGSFPAIHAGCRNGSLVLWNDVARSNASPSVFSLFKNASLVSIDPVTHDPFSHLEHYRLLSTTSDALYLWDDRRPDQVVWQYSTGSCPSSRHPISPCFCFDAMDYAQEPICLDRNGESSILHVSALEHSHIASFRWLHSPDPFHLFPMTSGKHTKMFSMQQQVVLLYE